MNKINAEIFQTANLSVIVTVRLTDAQQTNYTESFKMDSGYTVVSYRPRKAFIIKDKKTKDEASFSIETIYSFRDLLSRIFKGMIKHDVFYTDNIGALVPNMDEVNKLTFVFGNRFNSVKVRPDYKRIEGVETEGISIIFTNKNSIFIDHRELAVLLGLLHSTDFLTFSETIITNGLLDSLRKSKK